MGASTERVKELAAKWNCDYGDSIKMLLRLTTPSGLMKKGIDLFVDKVLGLDVDKYWEVIKDRGLEKNDIEVSLDGDDFCATKKDFVNMQVSPYGMGKTIEEAKAELKRS